MSAKSYRVVRTEDGVEASFGDKRIPLRLDLANHSPTGFEFGYSGSGPAQLSVAILAHYFARCSPEEIAIARRSAGATASTGELAVAFHQAFKSVVAAVPQETEDWSLSVLEISRALSAIYFARGAKGDSGGEMRLAAKGGA
jgi:hypothetical protein